MGDTHVEMSSIQTESDYLSSDDDSIEEKDVETDSNKEDDDQEEMESGGGLANAMAQILGKKIPKHKQVILAKGKSDREIKQKKEEREKLNVAEGKEAEKVHSKHEETTAVLEKKRLWEEMGRKKPDPAERDIERSLQKIAQRGVVQLFNAVRKQQKLLEEKTTGTGVTEAKRAKVVGNMTKGKFLDLLKGTGENLSSQAGEENLESKRGIAGNDGGDKKWSILRDDFMMGAKMKDWDKQISGSENSGSELPSSDSDNG